MSTTQMRKILDEPVNSVTDSCQYCYRFLTSHADVCPRVKLHFDGCNNGFLSIHFRESGFRLSIISSSGFRCVYTQYTHAYMHASYTIPYHIIYHIIYHTKTFHIPCHIAYHAMSCYIAYHAMPCHIAYLTIPHSISHDAIPHSIQWHATWHTTQHATTCHAT